jgi:hypothetical protein
VQVNVHIEFERYIGRGGCEAEQHSDARLNPEILGHLELAEQDGPNAVLLLSKPRGVSQVLHEPIALDTDRETFAQFVFGLPAVVERNPLFAISAKGLFKERVECLCDVVPLGGDDRPEDQGVGAVVVN